MTDFPAYTNGNITIKSKPNHTGQLFYKDVRRLLPGMKLHLHKTYTEYNDKPNGIDRHIIIPITFQRMKLIRTGHDPAAWSIICKHNSTNPGIYILQDMGVVPFRFNKHKRWVSNVWLTFADTQNKVGD